MKSDAISIPLVIPSSLEHEETRIVETFSAEGVEVSMAGVYMTKAAGPLPDANFWIDLTHHAEAFPLEHFIDGLEGALGVSLLAAFHRISKWALRTVRIHLRLPTKRQETQYIIPEEPEDKAAVKAIAKHYKTVRENPANEYFWVDGQWVSADDHFKAKRGGGLR